MEPLLTGSWEGVEAGPSSAAGGVFTLIWAQPCRRPWEQSRSTGPRLLRPWSLGVSSVAVWPGGLCRDHSSIFTQNLFGKMADILEKIKK